MTKFLLSVHVLAAILAIGPITVAASMFPRYVRPRAAEGDSPEGNGPEGENARTAALLHRVCRGYTVVGVAVPAFGVATGAQLGVLADAWLLASVMLTAAAAALLLLAILPGQQRLLARLTDGDTDSETATGTGIGTVEARRSAAARLAMITGIFNLLWAVVVVLMIVRPGSTTGA
ncbi:hypothetical protein OG978_21435 [Streptomyces sp. NBC_01591]|uniref:hypothetical protein n=1 Tax=Streptomyces sp. NBC_01591 TaxID=2975888 RepID=UPI002DDA01AC|nr:hypothetical protein [Streptomyces sp. NBC_01591]WSD69720.1 hypothetical protein OG978_21435 [Streptomyces sp. NBC_01591]